MTVAVQTTPLPLTTAEYVHQRDTGQLIDLAGLTIGLQDCTLCDTQHLGKEPCYTEVPCPDCGSTALRCKRPSEHEAAGWHADRYEELERVTLARIDAGETHIAAPWPRKPVATQDGLF